MKKYAFLSLFSVLFLASCHDYNDTYKKIDITAYKQYRPLDTLLNTKEYLVTQCRDTFADPEFERILVKREDANAKTYFLLHTDAFLENDSTIIHYDPALLYDDDGGFKKDGIWFYASSGSGKKEDSEWADVVSYSVDSIPAGTEKMVRPKQEGVYFYKNNRLIRISKEQSESAFREYKKDGFYFLPNTGRFFRRIPLASLR